MLSFQENEVICYEGDPCDAAFLVLSGEVHLSGREGVKIAMRDAIFGALSLVRGLPHSHTATALAGGVTLEVLSLAQVEALLLQVPPSVPQAPVEASPEPRQAMPETPPVSMPASGASQEAVEQGLLKVSQSMESVAAMMGRLCQAMEGQFQGGAPPAHDDAAYKPVIDYGHHHPRGAYLDTIAPLIDDDTVNDILINGPDNIFVERAGMLEKTPITFHNDMEVFDLARNIVKDIGRKIDVHRPLVDARLLDGSRVNIIAPPLAVDGTSISIRKFSKKDITLDSMTKNDNLSHEIAEFLKVVGKCRLNIVISGGTGSGKTTLLNAISQYIDKDERIVTIEDAAELRLQQPHVVRLETRPHHAGMKANEEVSMRDLVKNALRMRPDRIIVGEVRGPEAFDMLQAMNTGHEGSLTTVHANHPRDALSRLENMISMADLQIPIKSLRYQIASALHLIVQISRMRDGQRRITYISEVVGMEGDMITMHDLFNYKAEGEDEKGKITGKFKWSGIMPRFVRRVEYYGELARLEGALGVKFPKAIQLGKAHH